jgi:phage terminase small subunit
MKKLSRKAINEGLDTIPIAEILGVSGKDKGLTHKQQTFARELAKGTSKAESYRRAYSKTAKPKTAGDAGYRLSTDPRISAEVDAYKVAIESAKHRTPEALRQLVIKTLVDVAISPDAKDAVKVQAVKVLGTVVEVGAFLERREVITTTNSKQAKADLLQQIRTLMKGEAVDAIEMDADSLLAELAPEVEEVETLPDDTHPTATPHDAEQESRGDKHTIPLKQFPPERNTANFLDDEDPLE